MSDTEDTGATAPPSKPTFVKRSRPRAGARAEVSTSSSTKSSIQRDHKDEEDDERTAVSGVVRRTGAGVGASRSSRIPGTTRASGDPSRAKRRTAGVIAIPDDDGDEVSDRTKSPAAAPLTSASPPRTSPSLR